MVVCAVVDPPIWIAWTRRRPTRWTWAVKRRMGRVMTPNRRRIARLAGGAGSQQEAMRTTGPTSPTAPWLRMEVPTAVDEARAHAGSGRIVPIAVEGHGDGDGDAVGGRDPAADPR